MEYTIAGLLKEYAGPRVMGSNNWIYFDEDTDEWVLRGSRGHRTHNREVLRSKDEESVVKAFMEREHMFCDCDPSTLMNIKTGRCIDCRRIRP